MNLQAQLVRETGCHELEAVAALEMAQNNVTKARFHLENERQFRRSKFEPLLAPVWDRYSSSDATDYDGTIAFLTDLQVDFEHEAVLAVAYELGAARVGVFERRQWIDNWARLGSTNIEEMRSSVTKMAARLVADTAYFTRVYRFTFKYNLEPGHRLLDYETAQGYWALLLESRFKGVDRWIEFIGKQGHRVSADTWNMYLEFCRFAVDGLEGYDESASWPVVIDDFVEDLKSTVV